MDSTAKQAFRDTYRDTLLNAPAPTLDELGTYGRTHLELELDKAEFLMNSCPSGPLAQERRARFCRVRDFINGAYGPVTRAAAMAKWETL